MFLHSLVKRSVRGYNAVRGYDYFIFGGKKCVKEKKSRDRKSEC